MVLLPWFTYIKIDIIYGANVRARSGWQHVASISQLVGHENDVKDASDDWARPLFCLSNQASVLPWVCVISCSKAPFCMVSRLAKEFISFPFFSFSTTPLFPSNTVV